MDFKIAFYQSLFYIPFYLPLPKVHLVPEPLEDSVIYINLVLGFYTISHITFLHSSFQNVVSIISSSVCISRFMGFKKSLYQSFNGVSEEAKLNYYIQSPIFIRKLWGRNFLSIKIDV